MVLLWIIRMVLFMWDPLQSLGTRILDGSEGSISLPLSAKVFNLENLWFSLKSGHAGEYHSFSIGIWTSGKGYANIY